MNRRRWPTALVAVAISLSLVACQGTVGSTTPMEDLMTPQESRDDLTAVFENAQSLVGGEWQVQTDDAPRPCRLVNGTEGVQFSQFRYAGSTMSTADAVSLITAEWETLGFELSSREDTGAVTLTRVFATASDGRNLQFTAGENSMTLEGVSACAIDSE